MYCIYVWRPIMEASSTLEDRRPPVVSRRSRKVQNNCFEVTMSEYTFIFIIEVSVDNLENS